MMLYKFDFKFPKHVRYLFSFNTNLNNIYKFFFWGYNVCEIIKYTAKYAEFSDKEKSMIIYNLLNFEKEKRFESLKYGGGALDLEKIKIQKITLKDLIEKVTEALVLSIIQTQIKESDLERVQDSTIVDLFQVDSDKINKFFTEMQQKLLDAKYNVKEIELQEKLLITKYDNKAIESNNVLDIAHYKTLQIEWDNIFEHLKFNVYKFVKTAIEQQIYHLLFLNSVQEVFDISYFGIESNNKQDFRLHSPEIFELVKTFDIDKFHDLRMSIVFPSDMLIVNSKKDLLDNRDKSILQISNKFVENQKDEMFIVIVSKDNIEKKLEIRWRNKNYANKRKETDFKEKKTTEKKVLEYSNVLNKNLENDFSEIFSNELKNLEDLLGEVIDGWKNKFFDSGISDLVKEYSEFFDSGINDIVQFAIDYINDALLDTKKIQIPVCDSVLVLIDSKRKVQANKLKPVSFKEKVSLDSKKEGLIYSNESVENTVLEEKVYSHELIEPVVESWSKIIQAEPVIEAKVYKPKNSEILVLIKDFKPKHLTFYKRWRYKKGKLRDKIWLNPVKTKEFEIASRRVEILDAFRRNIQQIEITTDFTVDDLLKQVQEIINNVKIFKDYVEETSLLFSLLQEKLKNISTLNYQQFVNAVNEVIVEYNSKYIQPLVEKRYELAVEAEISLKSMLDFILFVEQIMYVNRFHFSASTAVYAIDRMIELLENWVTDEFPEGYLMTDYYYLVKWYKWFAIGERYKHLEDQELNGLEILEKIKNYMVEYFESRWGKRIVEYGADGMYIYSKDYSYIDRIRGKKHGYNKKLVDTKNLKDEYGVDPLELPMRVETEETIGDDN